MEMSTKCRENLMRLFMKQVFIFCEALTVKLKNSPDVVDITSGLNRLLAAARIQNGSLCAWSAGSTGLISTIEFEPGVAEDLKRAQNRMAPRISNTPANGHGTTETATAMSRPPWWDRLSVWRSETVASSWGPGSRS